MHAPHRRAILSIALLLAYPVSQVFAADTLDTIVVTATRTPTLSNELLSDVTVIDHEMLNHLGADTLPDVLGRISGIQITQSGGRGTTTTLSLRGANTNQTVVLIDGQRVSSATTGTAAIEHLPLDQIERIEILRGPASALYGSDAIGGVVQIFTRVGSGVPAPSFSLGAGSYRTTQGSAAYGGEYGDTRFNIQAGWENSNGFSAIRSPKGSDPYSIYNMFNPDDDDYRNSNVSARISQKINSDLSLGLDLLYIDTKTQFDSTNCDDFGMVCTSDYNNRNQQTLSSYAANLAYRINSSWKTSLRIGQSKDQLTNWRHDPTSAIYEQRQTYNTTQDQISWQNDVELVPEHRLMAAVDWRDQRVDSTQTFTQNSQTTSSVSLGYQGSFTQHSLQASVRSDHIESLGSHETGSLAYSYHLDEAWTLRAGVGTAFHAPTFNDLYWPLDPVNFFQGNPDLKPERSRNQDLSVSYERGQSTAGLTFYHNKVKDLLDFVPGSAPTWIGTYGNLNSATVKGASFQLARRSGPWQYRAALDWLSAKDDETGNTLQRRAPRTGTLEVRRQLAEFNFGAQLQGVSSRYNDRDNTQKLAGYGLLNLDATYRIDHDWSAFARLNNALGKEYTQVSATITPYNDYATAGRNIFIGVRYSPKP